MRLVVDTGIHAKGWSREQAQAYFREHAPSQSLAEVDRYIALPGQALAYKIGELRIQALRRRAEQALGPRFDVRAFHDVDPAQRGPPLEMLEEQVAAYIARSDVAHPADVHPGRRPLGPPPRIGESSKSRP